MFDRIRDWSNRNLPKREELAKNRWMKPFAGSVLKSELWRFTRRSVPRGTAVGLLIGIFLMIPGLQIIGAALLALPFRANVPVAITMTFLSNPLTTPLILVASVFVGNRLFGFHADVMALATLNSEGASLRDYASWLVSDAAPALISGLSAIAIVSALIGYAIAALLWRAWIARKWRHRPGHRHLHPQDG